VLVRSTDLLQRLRAAATPAGAGADPALAAEWQRSGVRFAATSPEMEAQWGRAVAELFACIRPTDATGPILQEGGVYLGCWLESTGTISSELLCRFLPSVAERTFSAFAEAQRSDGLLPYKLTATGPAVAQIQLVTPPARSVWTHYCLNGRPRAFLRRILDGLARYDAWLAAWRNTRGTGGVEAFCCYDTGHDLSPRFWHIPDSPWNNDPTQYDRDNPLLPLVAPDLTAAVACGRAYLARMAEELGEPSAPWHERARSSEAALFAQCHDPADGFFYDRDAAGRHIRVQSDVLLRVLASEIGDDALFAEALRRYLLNTRKFFAKYPFTSIALDDPRYDPAFDYNSWAGPTNLLSLTRAPHAFEHHGRHVELTWAMQPTLAALFRAGRFAQTLHPFTGREGFTESYSPALLCLLDFVERLCGILPRADGSLWFTCETPRQIEHRDMTYQTAYGRTVDGRRFELVNAASTSEAYRDGELLFRVPRGVRVVTDRTGRLTGLIGMRVGPVSGTLQTPAGDIAFVAAANQELQLRDGGFVTTRSPRLVLPES
jgi:hypothetical protein